MMSTDRTRPDAETATAVVEVKRNSTSIRDVRDGILTLLKLLLDRRGKQGYLLLVDSRLSTAAVRSEVDCIKAAMRADVADRFHLVLAGRNAPVERPAGASDADCALLDDYARRLTHPGPALSLPDKQGEVFLLVLHQWITGQGPVTAKWLEDTVDCNYRTVAAAIDRLGPAVARHPDRRVSLRHFPEQYWRRFILGAHDIRATVHYADASDQPRSPESLLRRLNHLQRRDIAVGGVIGARRYYEDLDMVGTPRLDLCIHAPGGHADVGFVRQLDPALEPNRDPHRPSRLALHFLRRKESLFDPDADGSLGADPVECLLELYIAGLDPQAIGFQEFLVTRGKELSGES